MPPPSNTALLQDTLDVLILRVLTLEPMHGLGISRRIAQVTNNTFQVKPGSLFPALHRLEEAGWLTAEWGESETNRRAKFYRLTKLGHRQLKQETENWSRISAAMANALEISLGGRLHALAEGNLAQSVPPKTRRLGS